MKKFSASLVAMAVALIMAPAAHAETTPGWYTAAGVGIVFPNNPTIYAGGAKSKAADENNNLDLLGSVGYAFDNGLRFEAEYFHNQMNTVTVNDINAFGHLTNNALFFNAFYDFSTNTMVSPYIGAGIGPDFINVKNVGIPGAFLDGDTVKAAYQGIVGLTAQINENWAVTADYRYIASFDPKVNYTGGTKGRMENASQNFILGVRYSFGAEKEAVVPFEPLRNVEAPAVVKQTPVKAVVAPIGQSFMVFFDFDKSTLTPEAKRIIASAVKEYQKDGFAKIVVTGHTDTVGTETYNQSLSERRAIAVKAELETLGIKAADIKEKGVGKGGLLVPTTDGVREAQNRRAEIVLSK